jgi:hypothetical protein
MNYDTAAKAGIQKSFSGLNRDVLDARLRGHDGECSPTAQLYHFGNSYPSWRECRPHGYATRDTR